MDKKVKKRLLLAMIFSTGFMFFLLKKVDGSHFSLIASRLDMKYFISSWGVFILGNFIRTLRFHKLDHTGNRLIHWWNINAFYNFTTATLPGGAGEAATVYILKRFSFLNIIGAFRILFLSRLLDLVALSALFLTSAFLISHDTLYREIAIWISGTLLLMSTLFLLPSSGWFVLKMTKRLMGQNRLIQKIYDKLAGFSLISEEQRRQKTYSTTIIQSIIMMTTGIISVHLLLRAVGIYFTPVQSTYCYGVYMIFQIVPVQGIAGIGTQAAWWTLALDVAGYSAPEAVALGFVLHGAFYVFICFLGLSALLIWIICQKFN
ncbi:MAG: UPF0104 family protein [Nitrospiraceae bacterium]|nr:MAG: UPF0104 family protein [Nitrospiraceae bacterium]